MMRSIPALIKWAKKHVLLALLMTVFMILFYAGNAFITGYAGRFGQSFVGDYTGRTVASYTVIDTMLHRFLVRFHASQIGVARFHDSVRNVGNNAMFLVTFESITTAPGVTADLSDLRNLPATTFGRMLPTLINGKTVFQRTRDMETGSLKQLAIRHGASAILYVPIHDLSERLIGILTISWSSESDVPDDHETMVKVLLHASARIGAYFSAVPEV